MFLSYNAMKSVSHQTSNELGMLLRGENNFLEFFWYKHGYKIKI